MISLARTPAHPARPARPGRSLRLVLPAAALLTALSASAALVAPAASAAPAGTAAAAGTAAGPASPAQAPSFTWHDFTLLNSWKTAGTAKLITGRPGWAVNNGVVYLRGAIKQTGSDTSDFFARLPKSARPTRNLYIQIFTQAAQPGVLFVGADGDLETYHGNATTFASLAAISFPTAAIARHKLTLTNHWASSQSPYNTGDPSYSISKGVVYLSGSLHGGTSSSVAFTLPKSARPTHVVYLSVYTSAETTGALVLKPNGKVQVYGSSASEYTSLANISYPVPGTKWHNFKLLDGWKSDQPAFSSGAPAYAVIDGVRYLSGSLTTTTATNGLWTRLPAVTRSPSVLEIEVYTFNASTGGIGITNSLGLVSSAPFTNAQAFTSLAGIAYAPGA